MCKTEEANLASQCSSSSLPLNRRVPYDAMCALIDLQPQVLGVGQTGGIRLALDKDGRKLAIKSFRLSRMRASAVERAKRELDIHLSLDHPHIARLEWAFESERELHLAIEHMAGGDLHESLYVKRHQFTESQASQILRQTLSAAAYMHAQSVVHRDFKLENIMFEDAARRDIKVIDLGLAMRWDGKGKISKSCGTPMYCAPEVYRQSYSSQADVWALGVISYELLVGSSPWPKQKRAAVECIKAGRPHFGGRFTELPGHAQDFLRSLLTLDPAVRPTASVALEHAFIRRSDLSEVSLDAGVMRSLQNYALASHWRRACLSLLVPTIGYEHRLLLRQQFEAIDVENRGAISSDSFRRAMQAVGLGLHEVDALFCELDMNGDGQISYSEFVAGALQDSVQPPQQAACCAIFQRFSDLGMPEFDPSRLQEKDAEDLIGETCGKFDDGQTVVRTEESKAEEDSMSSYLFSWWPWAL